MLSLSSDLLHRRGVGTSATLALPPDIASVFPDGSEVSLLQALTTWCKMSDSRAPSLCERAEDPAADYMIVRQELALYNAEYCARPHIVALNKMDLDDAAELRDEVSEDIMAAAKAMQVCQGL